VPAEGTTLEILEDPDPGVGGAGAERALVLDRREPRPQVDFRGQAGTSAALAAGTLSGGKRATGCASV
jgi:hypothetical protein